MVFTMCSLKKRDLSYMPCIFHNIFTFKASLVLNCPCSCVAIIIAISDYKSRGLLLVFALVGPNLMQEESIGLDLNNTRLMFFVPIQDVTIRKRIQGAV